MALPGLLEDSRAAQFGSSRLFCQQAILSPNSNSRRCNRKDTKSSQERPLVVAAAAAVAAVGAEASQSSAAAVGALGWWGSRCGDASNTTLFCPFPTPPAHRQRNWDPPEAQVAAVAVGAAGLEPVGAVVAVRAPRAPERVRGLEAAL